MKRSIARKTLTLLLSGLLIQTGLLAAPGPPPMGGPPCWPPPCLPIDGGVLFLLVAGMLLGGWKIYSGFYRKKAA
ncbi:MAG: PID-CTERM protein-sorting domain-containing protein [Bacteroidia bacterium]